MTLRLAEPISAEGKLFNPRIVGQTTLFPLEDELQKVVETTFQRAVQINKKASNDERRVTGFLHDWVKYEYDKNFRNNAERILSVFQLTLAPYIEGLKLLRLNESNRGFYLGPPWIKYETQQGDVKYSLIFRISDNSSYLIASPKLECKLSVSSVIRPALTGVDQHHVYERILEYIFKGKELAQEQAGDVNVTPWGYGFALKPVLVGDIPEAARELSVAARKLEGQSKEVLQAASLISFACINARRAQKLEEELGRHQLAQHICGPPEDRTYAKAKIMLDQVQIGETPILNKYFV